MTRVHDMGGRFGDGPVVPEVQSAGTFDAPWHARAMALTIAAGALGLYPLDRSRYHRESVPPGDYARFSYYEKWLAGLANVLVDTGAISREELAGAPAQPSGLAMRVLRADAVGEALAAGSPSARRGRAPRFAAGDRVRTMRPARNRMVDGGHTRLPRYAAGALGEVILCHGAHVLPDSNAHGLGEAPEPLYTVAFPAADLFGTAAHPADRVSCDLWESYLEPAT